MDMDMDMTIIMMKIMIDIHTHLMPFVDDGSKNIEMTKNLFLMFKEQKIKKVFLTPHVNSSVSYAEKEDHIKIYKKLKKISSQFDIELYLGAEIYLPFRMPSLDFSKYQMGASKFLLVEFSTFNETPILDHVYYLKNKGYDVIIAHIERYDYLDYEDILEIKKLGCFFQVNSNSILNKKNKEIRKRAIKYISNNLIDFVATDTHNLTNRRPRLLEAYMKLVKLVGKNEAKKLVYLNQMNTLLK